MSDNGISPASVQNEVAQIAAEKPAITDKPTKVLDGVAIKKQPSKQQLRLNRWRALNRRKTALYRHYDSKGNLLYVGISLSAVSRMSSHRTNAKWYRKVCFVTIQWHRTKEDALFAEARAILSEYPRYNAGHCHFTKSQNDERRALAKEGKWIKPPKDYVPPFEQRWRENQAERFGINH